MSSRSKTSQSSKKVSSKSKNLSRNKRPSRRNVELEDISQKEREEVLLLHYIQKAMEDMEKNSNNENFDIKKNIKIVERKKESLDIPVSVVKEIEKEKNLQLKKSFSEAVKGVREPINRTVLPPAFAEILREEEGKQSNKVDRKKEVNIIRDYSERYKDRKNRNNKQFLQAGFYRPRVREELEPESRTMRHINPEEDSEEIIELLVKVINKEGITKVTIKKEHFDRGEVTITDRLGPLVIVHFRKGGKRVNKAFSHLPEIPLFPELHGTIIDISNGCLINRSLPLPHDCITEIAYTNDANNVVVSWDDYWENYIDNMAKGTFKKDKDLEIPISKRGSMFYHPIPKDFEMGSKQLKVKYKNSENRTIEEKLDMRNDGVNMLDENISINIGTEGIVVVFMRFFGKTIYATHKKFNPPELTDIILENQKKIELMEGRRLYHEECDYSPFVYTYMLTPKEYVNKFVIYDLPPVQLLSQIAWTPSEDGKTYIDCPYEYTGRPESFLADPYNDKTYKGGEVMLQPSFVPGDNLWCILYYGIMFKGVINSHDISLIRSAAEELFTDGHFVIVTKTDDNGRVLDCYKLMSMSYELKNRLTGGNNNLYNVFCNMLGHLNNEDLVFNSLFEDRLITTEVGDIVDLSSRDFDTIYNDVIDKIEDLCYFMREDEGIEKCRRTMEHYRLLAPRILNNQSTKVREVLEKGVLEGKSTASYWLLRYKIACVFCNFVMCYSNNKFEESLDMLKRFYEDVDKLRDYLVKVNKNPEEELNRIYIKERRGGMTPARVYEVKKKVKGIIDSIDTKRNVKKAIGSHILRHNLGERFYKIITVLRFLGLID